MADEVTAADIEAGMKKTLTAQSAQIGQERIQRPDLAAQVKAHQYLTNLEARRARARPFLSSIDLSGI